MSNDVAHQRPNLTLRGVIHAASLAQIGQTSAANVVDLNRRYSEYRGFDDLTRLKKNNTGCLNRCGCPFWEIPFPDIRSLKIRFFAAAKSSISMPEFLVMFQASFHIGTATGFPEIFAQIGESIDQASSSTIRSSTWNSNKWRNEILYSLYYKREQIFQREILLFFAGIPCHTLRLYAYPWPLPSSISLTMSSWTVVKDGAEMQSVTRFFAKKKRVSRWQIRSCFIAERIAKDSLPYWDAWPCPWWVDRQTTRHSQ